MTRLECDKSQEQHQTSYPELFAHRCLVIALVGMLFLFLAIALGLGWS